MKTYRIIEDPHTHALRAVVTIHRPALGLYGKELGLVQAHDHTQAMELAHLKQFDEPRADEPWA